VNAGKKDGFYDEEPVGGGIDDRATYEVSKQFSFYANTPDVAQDTYPYGEKRFEESPLNRVLAQAAPGEPWHFDATEADGVTLLNSHIKNIWTTNQVNEVVKWKVSLQDLVGEKYYKLYTDAFYSKDELWINIVEDEHGNMSCEYKDMFDRLILKKSQVGLAPSIDSHDGWACTYYIYDDFSNLRYVIPPQAVQEMVDDTNNWTKVNDPLDGVRFIENWLFYYEYDGKQRMRIKKVPGAEPVYMVYDERNRVVLTQDGNQRSTQFGDASGKEWLFTKYDAFDRPVITGIYKHNTESSQADMQGYVNERVGKVVDDEPFAWFESRSDAITSLHGYDNTSFPKKNHNDSDLVIYSVNYYDDYSFINSNGLGKPYFDDGTNNYSYDNSINTILQPTHSNVLLKGQITGTKVKVLDPQGGDEFLNTISYYDDRYRLIQVKSTNYLGEMETATSCYSLNDLTKNVSESILTYPTGDIRTIHRRYNYDHAQRLEYVEHKINDGDFIKTFEMAYNELGEVMRKDLHLIDGEEPWQTVDFKYNIRGWLTHINDPELSEDPKDYFGMELGYDKGFLVPLYNGNISGIKWKTSLDDDRLNYAYSYDKLNRITRANFSTGTQGIWNNIGDFDLAIAGDESGNSGLYDLNGNILGLERYGIVDGHQSAIDMLTYDYNNGASGNQLLNVSDEGTNEGFKDGTVDIDDDGVDYHYDANGNMCVDDNKEIENIGYNYLNLPQVIEFTDVRKIEYVYDASGTKLAQRVYDDDEQPATRLTEYYWDQVFETDSEGTKVLQFLHHEEGRVVPGPEANAFNWTQNSPDWEYQYHLKDHLGNTRITFGAPETITYIATMEEGENRLIEENEMGFENITNTEWSDANLDHTHLATDQNGDAIMPGAHMVSFLDGVNERTIGPARSIKVIPGDQVDINVFYKYAELSAGSHEKVLGRLLLVAFTSSFGAAGVDLAIQNGGIDADYLENGLELIGDDNLEKVPDAYINYIYFDKYFGNPIGKKKIIQSEGNIADMGDHGELSHAIACDREGYIYIYLSNETEGSSVYFDDLTIRHTQNGIIQKNDPYPFGLNIDALSASREYSIKNKWTFQGQELQDDFDLGWYAFKYRNHQPEIGRFFNVDPLAEEYLYNSTYAFSENRVVDAVEVEGLESTPFMASFSFHSTMAEMHDGWGNYLSYRAKNWWNNNFNFIHKFENLRDSHLEFRRVQDKIENNGYDHLPNDGLFNIREYHQRFDMFQAQANMIHDGAAVVHVYSNYLGLTMAAQQGALAYTYNNNLSMNNWMMRGAARNPSNLGINAAKTSVQVEQYTLKAARDGFYPVMKRGFKAPQELVYLNRGDVWKFGTTKNPLTRYTQNYLNNTGAGLRYSTEFSGTLKQSLQLENMKIRNYLWNYKYLPPGNKMIK
jgi:RHS repeat-associated protein